MDPGIIDMCADGKTRHGIEPFGAFVLDSLGNIDAGGLRFDNAEQLRLYLRAELQGTEHNETGIYHLQATSRRKAENFLRVLCLPERENAGIPGWIIVDEAKKYLDPHQPLDALKGAVDFGRNFNQSFVAVGRGFTHVHKHLRRNAQAVISFRQPDVSDYPHGLEGDREAITRLSEHDVTHLGTLPTELDALTNWPNYRPN
jgi:hypothetical protein